MISNETFSQRISHHIRRELNRRGMSLRALARKTGDNHQTITDAAQGKRGSHPAVFFRIAEALETTVDDLYRGRPSKKTAKSS